MFTGRQLDILDNGSLKIQYNRNRYYDHYTARFLQHDPLGINPAGGTQNPFEVVDQYASGLGLYEYVGSSPIVFSDPQGLLRLPNILMNLICDEPCKCKGKSWEIHPKLRVNLFFVTYDAKCDCSFGYSWTGIPKKNCKTSWDQGKLSFSRTPDTLKQVIKNLEVSYTATYGNSVASGSVSGSAKGYFKSWWPPKAGIKYAISYSASAQALVWIDYPCCDCARGYVSCSCTGKVEQNFLGQGAAAAAFVGVWYALPAIPAAAEALATGAYALAQVAQ